MSGKFLIHNTFIVNEGNIRKGDIYISEGVFKEIVFDEIIQTSDNVQIINAEGLYAFPGLVDDQVHFREPGLVHKGDIWHESRAAVAGGVTSFMDMPNTKPPALTQVLLEEKYLIAQKSSLANFSFYMGVSNSNYEEVLKTPLETVCGIKIFLGASTGNLLVDDMHTLERIFKESPHLIAVHCEDDSIIRHNLENTKLQFGENIPLSMHHVIRSAEACYSSTQKAVNLARKHNARLHVLHISTEEELKLLDNSKVIQGKKITGEVCVHHLWFTADDYETLGSKIKWNPSIKEKRHRDALRKALKNGLIDIVATDHAPHTLEEKSQSYENCPSGAPIIQFSLQIMLELVKQGVISLTDIPRLMSHNPALLYNIRNRGFIRKGYFADMVLVNIHQPYLVSQEKIYSKCRWSPLENYRFSSSIMKTFVNGNLVCSDGIFEENVKGMRLEFNRKN